MRKNLIILPAAIVALGLASCNKGVSRDAALKFVKENYKNTETKPVTKRSVKWDFSKTSGNTAIEAAKLTIGFLIDEVPTDLKGSKDVTTSGIIPLSENPLNENNFNFTDEKTETVTAKYTFSISGKELTVNANTTSKVSDAITLKAVQNATYNSDGYMYKCSESFPRVAYDTGYLEGSISYTNTF